MPNSSPEISCFWYTGNRFIGYNAYINDLKNVKNNGHYVYVSVIRKSLWKRAKEYYAQTAKWPQMQSIFSHEWNYYPYGTVYYDMINSTYVVGCCDLIVHDYKAKEDIIKACNLPKDKTRFESQAPFYNCELKRFRRTKVDKKG